MRRLAVVLTALALSLFAAPAAEAARSEFFGIVQGTLDAQDRQGMANANVGAERFLIRWKSVEPSAPVGGVHVYDWAARDHFIGALASKGIRPVPFLWGSPAWVGNGKLAQPPTANAADRQAWQAFLAAAVARYGPGGTYWSSTYPQQFPGADPLPIETWQIWNEPNLKKFFSPGQNVQASAQKYVTLLQLSHNTITSLDPQARILLAGMPGVGDSTAWMFLRNIYQVPGAKDDFDIAALHPYSCSVDGVRQEMAKFRAEMTSHADGATPLWVTEFAWGSGPPDQFCKNKGLDGQKNLLANSFNLFLDNRKAWNLQSLFWFLWRDPEKNSPYANLCSICGTAGLLKYSRTAKPALATFKSFTTETTPPQASITTGPAGGSFINDPTPTFSFNSNDPGSTFACKIDAGTFTTCVSPYTVPQLSNGAHTFSVKAIDAPGNESAVRSRSFTVDTTPPQTTITTGPSGATSDNTPTFNFTSSEGGSTFKCRFDSAAFAPCSGPGASHTASSPLSLGAHTFDVRAIDKAKNSDSTPAHRSFTVIL